MSWIINKKYIICILLLLTTFIHKAKSYVLCDDDKTACPNNYDCCKRSKGYICCHNTMVCCNYGESCCERGFFGEIKNHEEKPKLPITLLEIKSKLDIENNNDNFIAEETNSNNNGLFGNFSEAFAKIKTFIIKNLKQQSPEFFVKIQRIEKSIKNVKNLIKDDSFFIECYKNILEEIEMIVNEFLNEYKGSEIYEILNEFLSYLIKLIKV